MASRKVLQEISVLPPMTEAQSFVVVPEEAMLESCNQLNSLPARAHAKYISNDESKENITPAEFDTGDKYKPEGLTGPQSGGDQERWGNQIPLQLNNEVTPGMTAGAESTFTPRRHSECSDWRIGESTTPMDFSTVTVDDFGISRDSFINSVGKSPKSLHKHRRRSTIGVRGSPEMNFLIRQIALQRSNRKMDPEPQSSPFISPRNLMLKEKMSSFRNAFQAVEENEGKLPFPGFSEEEKTQGSKVSGNTCEKIEPPEKRKRVSDAAVPEMQSVPVKARAPLLRTQPKETTPEMVQVPVLEKISESEGSPASKFSAAKSVNLQKEEIQPVPSSTRGRKRKVVFSEISSSPESAKSSFHNETHRSQSCKSPSSVLRPALKKTSRIQFGSKDESGDQRVCFLMPESGKENTTLFKKIVNDSVKKKRRVTFGKELSPELFDKTLPPNTPLRKGSTPCHPHEPDTAKPTVQEMVHQSPGQSMPQPDFDCREEDTFAPLSLCFDTESPSQDSSSGNDDQVWPTVEVENVFEENHHKEEDESLLRSNEWSNEFPENTTSAPALDTETANETFIASEPDTVPINGRVTRFTKRSKASSSEDPPISDNPQTTGTSKVTATAKPPSKRGRKPVIVKVQVKIPKGKVKKSRGRPKKTFQKPVYVERETVSKKPPLSPIPELPECYPTPPASTLVSSGGSFNKGLGKRVAKRKVIHRNMQKNKVPSKPSKVVELISDPVIMKIEDVLEDSGCEGKEGFEVQFTDGERQAESVDFIVDTLSTSTDCDLSSDNKVMKQDQEFVLEQSESVPECNGTEETMTAVKPQNKSKRRSTTRRRASQTPGEIQHLITETLKDFKTEHNTVETVIEDPQPEKDLLVKAPSPELLVNVGVASKRRGRRSSKNYPSPVFCPSTAPTIHSQDPSTTLPHPNENPSSFPIEPLLPIDEILQSAGTEKRVRRSLRLRRESGGSGLSWVQESMASERPKRKSLSTAVPSLESSNRILESLTQSPNKEQLSVEEPSAAKKARRTTLCTSTLQQITSVYDKRRRSNNFFKDSSKTQACHNSITLDT